MNNGVSELLKKAVQGFSNHNLSEKIDDFAGDLDYLNDIRDERCQRAPRRKFERLDPFEYYDDAEFVDRFRFTKEEMRSHKFTLTPVR